MRSSERSRAHWWCVPDAVQRKHLSQSGAPLIRDRQGTERSRGLQRTVPLRFTLRCARDSSLHRVGGVEAVDERGPVQELLVQLHVLGDAPQLVEMLAA